MKKIQTEKNLPELIYDSVVNAIVEGLLKPGGASGPDGVGA